MIPLFVSNSCISCHAGDGKGHPATSLIRFGQTDETGNHFLTQGGPQLQHRAISGFTPENINLILDECHLKGIELKGGKEENPGSKDLDDLENYKSILIKILFLK